MLFEKNSRISSKRSSVMDSDMRELAFKASSLEHEKNVMENLLQDADEQLQNQTETISMLEARCKQQALALEKERQRLTRVELDCTSLEDELATEKARQARLQPRRRSSTALLVAPPSRDSPSSSPSMLRKEDQPRSGGASRSGSLCSIDSLGSVQETPVPDELDPSYDLDASVMLELLPQLQLLETSLAEKEVLAQQVARLQQQLDYREQQLQEARREMASPSSQDGLIHMDDDRRTVSPSGVMTALSPSPCSLADELHLLALSQVQLQPRRDSEDDEFHDASDTLDPSCVPTVLEQKLATVSREALLELLSSGPCTKQEMEARLLGPLDLDKAGSKAALAKLRTLLYELEASDQLLMTIRDDALVFMLR
eukprot:m.175941 g.175941  ORF g.175941 m.175941 type:complete len:371 (+) comp16792_c0_seq1:96-1208(+)